MSRKTRCTRCSGSHSNTDNACKEKFCCPHCPEENNEHSAAGRKCPLYRHEEAVIRVKTDESISWAEARKRVSLPNARPTYASVADADNVQKDKLIETLVASLKNLTEKVNILMKENEKYAKIETEFSMYKERVKNYLREHNISPAMTPTKERSQATTPTSRSGTTTPVSNQQQENFHKALQQQLQKQQKQEQQPKLGFQAPKSVPKKPTVTLPPPMSTRQTTKTNQSQSKNSEKPGKRGPQSPLANKKKNKNAKQEEEEEEEEEETLEDSDDGMEQGEQREEQQGSQSKDQFFRK
ncbi:UPF0746 protein DDB_G0281095-like [Uranotaenia lowii]|uniref:UPF0746 protein DDB_G0281095-like n=1 Tax=Uranotaenia lowii TaxID=190385 RepID=UPI0024799427|nr:UPF0746 protein DDB_G0281095-like [Uranotaenia lowii]